MLSKLRPGVVWFNESLDQSAQLASGADLMLVIGKSGVIYPAAGLPSITRRNGGRIIHINPEKSEYASNDPHIMYIQQTAASILPKIFQEAVP